MLYSSGHGTWCPCIDCGKARAVRAEMTPADIMFSLNTQQRLRIVGAMHPFISGARNEALLALRDLGLLGYDGPSPGHGQWSLTELGHRVRREIVHD